MDAEHDPKRYILIAKRHAASCGWSWEHTREYANFDAETKKCYVSLGDDEPFAENVWITIDADTLKVEQALHLPKLLKPVSRKAALQKATDYATANGWPWSSEVYGRPDWEFDPSENCRHVWVFDLHLWSGANTHIVVDAEMGIVVSGYRAEY